jgi:predicted aconitase with swiveling domain
MAICDHCGKEMKEHVSCIPLSFPGGIDPVKGRRPDVGQVPYGEELDGDWTNGGLATAAVR